jgi:hypothetical protein
MNVLKPWLLAGSVTLGAGMLGGGTAITPTAIAQDGANWMLDYPAAKAAARQSGKPIFLVIR